MTPSTNPTEHVHTVRCCGKGGIVLPSICVVLRVALGGLFLLAAYNKLFIVNGPQLFSASVQAFKVFDPKSQEQLIQLATFVTPWIELVASVSLILGFWTRAAAGILGALLVGFIVLIASALLRDLNVSCGCFGKISPFCPEKIGACNIVQNSIMLLAALVIIACKRHVLAVDQLFQRRPKAECC